MANNSFGKARKKTQNLLSPSQKRTRRTGVLATIITTLVTVVGIGLLIWLAVFRGETYQKQKEANASLQTEMEESAIADAKAVQERKAKAQAELEEYIHSVEPTFEFAHFKGEPTLTSTGDAVLDEAYLLAAGYDYDAAVQKVKTVTGYGNKPEYKEALARFYAEKAALSQWEINNNITHIFFHSLICNPAITFDKVVTTYKLNDYNEAMTTVKEFVSIIESMYEKGFVLVDIYDVAKMEIQDDGSEKMKYQSIMLPEGKIPFILSIDDTNYYEYMGGQGFARHLLVNEEGKVVNDYVLQNGDTVYGSFDVIPILEDFIELHPDFSYKGGRGIAGITGYNGVLGYRTSDFWYTKDCPYYIANDTNDKYFREEILSGYNGNIEADKETAKKTANAIKALGWRFASHTWGHKRLGEVALETMDWDSDMWRKEVEPILGETDLLIFPYGNDFGQGVGWRTYEYQGPNDRYRLMKSYGFNYFFNVDSSVYFMQRTDEYFRQGRRNLDGERLWEAVYADEGREKYKNRVSDLVDSAKWVIDPLRPEIER